MFCWFISYFKSKESTFPNLCLTKFRYDGDFFVRNLDASVERSTKRGKGPRRTRYIQYCTWAHALLVRTYSCLALGYRCSPCKSMCHILTYHFVNFPSEKRSWAWRCRICVTGGRFIIHKKNHSRGCEGRDTRVLSVTFNSSNTFISYKQQHSFVEFDLSLVMVNFVLLLITQDAFKVALQEFCSALDLPSNTD